MNDVSCDPNSKNLWENMYTCWRMSRHMQVCMCVHLVRNSECLKMKKKICTTIKTSFVWFVPLTMNFKYMTNSRNITSEMYINILSFCSYWDASDRICNFSGNSSYQICKFIYFWSFFFFSNIYYFLVHGSKCFVSTTYVGGYRRVTKFWSNMES